MQSQQLGLGVQAHMPVELTTVPRRFLGSVEVEVITPQADSVHFITMRSTRHYGFLGVCLFMDIIFLL